MKLVVLAVSAALAGGAGLARAGGPQVTGTWASKSTSEHMVFKSNGYLRTCFGGAAKGNAAMGSWSEKEPGKIVVEFTHAISPSCATAPVMQHKYAVKIVGYATVSKAELALFVSGEFPPDRYLKVEAASLR